MEQNNRNLYQTVMTFDTNCSILPYAQTSYTFLLLKLPVVLSKVTGNDDILILWIEIFPLRINHFFDCENVDISFFVETKGPPELALF